MQTLTLLIYWGGLSINAIFCGIALWKASKLPLNKTTALFTLCLIATFSAGFSGCLWIASTLLEPNENHSGAYLIGWILTGILPSSLFLGKKYLSRSL